MDAQTVVIGAGVVGLAAAAELAAAGLRPLVIERNAAPGRETSSRNSGVIHAGIYYPAGSLKARLCVRGNALLYRRCERDGIAHRRLGKLIVAGDSRELAALERLKAHGDRNGASALQLIDRQTLARLEPGVRGVGALLSPSSGVVDAHGLVKALEGAARAAGAEVLYRARVVGLDPVGGAGFELALETAGGRERLRCRLLVNAAGLHADEVAALAGIHDYRLHWCRGDYFSVGGPALASRLIFPLPQPRLAGLGVHLTLDLGGRARLGPDVSYIAREAGGDRRQPDVDPAKADAFFAAAHRLLPALRREQLAPDTWGIRPKLHRPDEAWRDFIVVEESGRGLPGMINLVGIESPGLTAALAIGEEVVTLARQAR